jgi:hypothetical protein
MKKKNLKVLRLNKKSVSSLQATSLSGGGPVTINCPIPIESIERCVTFPIPTNSEVLCYFTADEVCVIFTRNNECGHPSLAVTMCNYRIC